MPKPVRPAGAARPVLSYALCAVPVVALAALAWSRRWTSDDGFINLRVVQQLLAGNGPVFNAGERVEITTSPAWVAVLLLASRAVPLRSDVAHVVVAHGNVGCSPTPQA